MYLNFDPFFLFPTSHAQTVWGTLFYWPFNPPSQTKYVLLPDGDFLAMEVTTPKKWKKTDKTAVMIHGLCGSHRSSYLLRLTRKLKKKGVRVVRLNLRGCGTGKGKARHLYHAGQSSDVLEALKVLKQEAPDSPIILVGFSLGGNLALKLAGEMGKDASMIVKKIFAINPPVDLQETVKRIAQSWFYEKYFVTLLSWDVKHREKIFPELPKTDWPHISNFMEFDEFYLAPRFGYSNVQEYYEQCSAKKYIPQISVPCHILFSKDDPIIATHVIESISLPDNVSIFLTEKGGHMGYLGNPFKSGGFYWMDNLVTNWIISA
jgi:predicted alpha/beta-fold hydrolase